MAKRTSVTSAPDQAPLHAAIKGLFPSNSDYMHIKVSTPDFPPLHFHAFICRKAFVETAPQYCFYAIL
jgi:hypothetical protein